MHSSQLLRRYRLSLGVFILGLVISGITAFPLRWELNYLASMMGIPNEVAPNSLTGLKYWIAHVQLGISQSYDTYPFLAYGTDWLAFAHLVIAVFFIGAFRNPTSHDWTLISGIIACVAVFPLAMVCGHFRGIPFYWRCIDCCFGLLGSIPLFYCFCLSRRLQARATQQVARANDR